VVEVHPEVSFTALAGHPMEFHKRTPEGRAERLAALRSAFSDIDLHAGKRVPGTNADDILDAFVAAWSARRWVNNTYRRLGGELDDRGLRMEMIA
jgi:predicted RNase H-like nuclease